MIPIQKSAHPSPVATILSGNISIIDIDTGF